MICADIKSIDVRTTQKNIELERNIPVRNKKGEMTKNTMAHDHSGHPHTFQPAKQTNTTPDRTHILLSSFEQHGPRARDGFDSHLYSFLGRFGRSQLTFSLGHVFGGQGGGGRRGIPPSCSILVRLICLETYLLLAWCWSGSKWPQEVISLSLGKMSRFDWQHCSQSPLDDRLYTWELRCQPRKSDTSIVGSVYICMSVLFIYGVLTVYLQRQTTATLTLQCQVSWPPSASARSLHLSGTWGSNKIAPHPSRRATVHAMYFVCMCAFCNWIISTGSPKESSIKPRVRSFQASVHGWYDSSMLENQKD